MLSRWLMWAPGVRQVTYKGCTWGLKMPHGFLVTRRAQSDTTSTVVLASRATIDGDDGANDIPQLDGQFDCDIVQIP